MSNSNVTSELFEVAVGFKPFFYQQNLIENNDLKLIINKPRQCGVTTAYEYKYLVEGMFGRKSLVVSKSYKEAANFISELRRMNLNLVKMGLSKNPAVVNRADFIEFEGGGYVQALANTTSTGRSYSVDNIFLDEFAMYQNAEELYLAILPTTTTKHDFQIVVNSTPRGEGGMYADLWRNFEKKGYKKILIELKDNPGLFTPEKIRELRQSLDDLGFQQEFCNQFLGSELSYFKMDLINSCVDESLSFGELDKNKIYMGGFDVGRVSDKSCIVITTVENGVVKVVGKKVMANETFANQLSYVKSLLESFKFVVFNVDASGMGMPLGEELVKKFPHCVNALTFTNELKVTGFLHLRKLFEERKILLPDDLELKRALNLIERRQHDNSVSFDAPRNDEGHSDSAMALMLACYEKSRKPTIHSGQALKDKDGKVVDSKPKVQTLGYVLKNFKKVG